MGRFSRGLYAAASLKRRPDRSEFHRDPARFPRLYAAASLKPMRGGNHRRPLNGFPRLYAAASLKLRAHGGRVRPPCGFPRLYAAASLKPAVRPRVLGLVAVFSAALCRGLIEASTWSGIRIGRSAGFPRLYAAASLKPAARVEFREFSIRVFRGFYAAASLKQVQWMIRSPASRRRFPRLYAAASLKHHRTGRSFLRSSVFSAALCRGLIEAEHPCGVRLDDHDVFRGFMPRPH